MKISFISILFMLLVSISILSGCKQQPPKIGILICCSDNANEQRKKDYLVDNLTKMGAEVMVDLADKQGKQIQQAQEMIKKGAKVLIIVSTNQNESAKIVELAHKENVKIIAYDHWIDGCQLDYYVSVNSFEIGEIQASYITSLKPSGNYALICGSKNDKNAMKLYTGQMNVLQPYMEKGNIQVVYSEFTEDSSADQGSLHANHILDQNPDITAIIAWNDEIAEGVITTLKERGLEGKVLVAGQDAELYNVRAIIDGAQTCTVLKPLKEMAQVTGEIAVSLALDKPLTMKFSNESNGKSLIKSVLITAALVNKNNLETTVGGSGYYTLAQIK